jgi:hypothetical protein
MLREDLELYPHTFVLQYISVLKCNLFLQNSSLLLSELLHNESVTHVKCQSFEPARHAAAQEHSEELYVMYPSAVCVLTGFGLFQTLRACRNQLARGNFGFGAAVKEFL